MTDTTQLKQRKYKPIVCQICKNQFIPDCQRRKYCSEKCSRKATQIRTRERVQRYRERKGEIQIIRTCKWCKQEFKLNRKAGKHRLLYYCCNKCRKEAYKYNTMLNVRRYRKRYREQIQKNIMRKPGLGTDTNIGSHTRIIDTTDIQEYNNNVKKEYYIIQKELKKQGLR